MSDVTQLQGGVFAQMLSKARDAAAGGINAMSKSEAVAAALVLNRPDWLASMGFSIAEALERIGPDWARLVPDVAKQFTQEREESAEAVAERARIAKAEEFAAQQPVDGLLELSAKVVTYGDSPGYRDVYLTVELTPQEKPDAAVRARIHLDPESGEKAVRFIKEVHEFAWNRSGGRPIDAKPDELKPRWIK